MLAVTKKCGLVWSRIFFKTCTWSNHPSAKINFLFLQLCTKCMDMPNLMITIILTISNCYTTVLNLMLVSRETALIIYWKSERQLVDLTVIVFQIHHQWKKESLSDPSKKYFNWAWRKTKIHHVNNNNNK
jgi:hypothetical protein